VLSPRLAALDPARDLSQFNMLRERPISGEVKVNLDLKTLRGSERLQRIQIHVAEVRAPHTEVTESVGNIDGVKFGQEPNPISIGSPESDLRPMVRRGKLGMGGNVADLVIQDQLAPKELGNDGFVQGANFKSQAEHPVNSATPCGLVRMAARVTPGAGRMLVGLLVAVVGRGVAKRRVFIMLSQVSEHMAQAFILSLQSGVRMVRRIFWQKRRRVGTKAAN
jgi:hypothetical protein